MHKKYFYSDGNGNGYIISGDTLSYNPIDIMHSSSGMYDGGEAKELVLSDEQKKHLVDLFLDAISKPQIQDDKRRKGTGMITIFQGQEMKRYIIRWRSEERGLIETALRKLVE